jgi:hypothetical protein
MRFAEFLDVIEEVHWEDIYTPEFKTFRKEWGKFARSGSYYVQFSNHKSDPLHRVGHSNPDHHDPVGDYAYPLKYVIEHPADIWYGRTAKFLRVLQDTSRNKIILSDMTENQASSLLYKIGMTGFMLDYAKKFYKIRGKNWVGRAFMRCVQYDLSTEPRDGEHQFRSQEMQSHLLQRMGIDAIEDKARKQTVASINPREPNQICFLNRYAFKVIKVYKLHGEDVGSLVSVSPNDRMERKLAQSIFNAIDGDSIASGPEDGYFWSQKGRVLYVSFDVPSNYSQTRKLGEKKHKEYKWHDQYKITVILERSEKGRIEGRYSRSTKFDEIIADMVNKWRKGFDSSFEPDSVQAHRERKRRESEEAARKAVEEKNAKAEKEEVELIPAIQQLGEKLGLPWRPTPGREYRYVDILNAVGRHARKGSVADAWRINIQNYNQMKGEMNDAELFSIGFLPPLSMSNYPDLYRLAQITEQIPEITKMEFQGAWSIRYALQSLERRADGVS